ncbi:MAG: hypothetical protein ABWY05_05045 [Noviherbaspirillum sp.]
MNTTLIEGKQRAEYDAAVLKAMTLAPPALQSVSAERLLVGIRNEQGDVYRVIRISGLGNFLALIGKLRELGFSDEFAEASGDKEGFDVVVARAGQS